MVVEAGRAEKLPPHDVEAEEAIVASLLVDPEAIYKIAPILKPEDFFREKNAWAYEACLSLWERSQSINQITVAHELARRGRLEETGGAAYLAKLVVELPTSVGVEHYAGLVQRDSSYRKLITAAGQIAQMAYIAGPDGGGGHREGGVYPRLRARPRAARGVPLLRRYRHWLRRRPGAGDHDGLHGPG